MAQARHLVVAEQDPRLTWPERELVRQLGAKLYGRRPGGEPMSRRIKPHKVRGREIEEIRDADPDGRPVLHYQVIDPLTRMLRGGTITDAMYNAARDFQAAFVIAHLEPLRALPMLRVPGTGRPSELNEFQLDARHRVQEALDALGGLSSPAGSCVWHVVGGERSLRDWALRQCWSGRPLPQGHAQGILVAALGILAARTDLRRRRREQG